MITRKQIEEILDDTLEGDNPPDSAPTVVGKEECVNRLMELVKNCSIPDVVHQREQFKSMVFDMANKLAIAGHGDEAVMMHKIHNRF